MNLSLRLWWLLHVVYASRRLVPFHRVLRTILEASSVPAPDPDRLYPEPEEILAALDAAAARSLRPMKCLERSLALVWCLRRKGLRADLEIGFRRTAGGIAGHAWVVLDGQTWGEKEGAEADYVPMLLSEAAGAQGT